jgi:hypothetical protein
MISSIASILKCFFLSPFETFLTGVRLVWFVGIYYQWEVIIQHKIKGILCWVIRFNILFFLVKTPCWYERNPVELKHVRRHLIFPMVNYYCTHVVETFNLSVKFCYLKKTKLWYVQAYTINGRSLFNTK